MISKLLKKKKDLHLERTYRAPAEAVWAAWTEADRLRQWWAPPKATVVECELDLSIGGRIYVVTEAGAEMGKYQGTQWPMDGNFTVIEPTRRLVYDARSWTSGEEEETTIRHTNEVTVAADGDRTTVTLHVSISEIGPKAKMAAFGMKWGYKAQLDGLDALLTNAD